MKDLGNVLKDEFLKIAVEFRISLQYIFKDTVRRPRNYAIAFSTILIVVTFVIVLQNAIQGSPIAFLKLTEDQVGEYDLLMVPRLDFRTGSLRRLLNTSEDIEQLVNETTEEGQDSGLNNFFEDGVIFWLNETWISEQLSSEPLVTGTCPRWTILGEVRNKYDIEKNSSVVVLVIDSEREEDIGLGRSWNKRALGEEECYISGSVLRQIGVTPNAGERVYLSLDILALADTLGVEDQVVSYFQEIIKESLQNETLNFTINSDTVNFTQIFQDLGLDVPQEDIDNINSNVSIPLSDILTDEGLDNATTYIFDILFPFLEVGLSNNSLRVELIVVDEVNDPDGKWPTSLGNVLILEEKWITTLFKQVLPIHDTLSKNILQAFGVSIPELEEQIDSIRLSDYALLVIVMYEKRFEAYVLDRQGLDEKMIQFTNQVAEAIGIDYHATFSLPIAVGLQSLYFIRLFLDQIMTAVMVVLVVLSVMLVYSLLLSDVEQKTYEFGMMRALGMKHQSLITLLIIQSFTYSIPAILVGLILAYLLSLPVSYLIGSFSATSPNYTLSEIAIILGVVLGILLPLISNIVPISRALSKTLRDSLDIYHQVTSETTVQMIKLENIGLSLWQVILSITMVIIGFIVYYMIPYSFTFNDLSLFFGILNAILLGMLFGAAAVASALQPFLETKILNLIVWGPDRKLIDLVRKSLSGHRRRNAKTAMMFTISLAFILFAGAMFTLQANSINSNLKSAIGADVVIVSQDPDTPLDEDRMRDFLDSMKYEYNLVDIYTFVTFPLDQMSTNIIQNTDISNLAAFPWIGTMVVGVESSYLSTIFTDYFMMSAVDEEFSYHQVDGKDDVIRSLYDDAGQASLPEEEGGIQVPPVVISDPFHLKEEYLEDENEETYTEYVDVIVSEAYRYALSIDIGVPMRLETEIYLKEGKTSKKEYLAKVRAMLRKLPGFFYSSYRQTAGVSTTLITMDNYQRLFEEGVKIKMALAQNDPEILIDNSSFPLVPPKQKVLVNLKSGLSRDQREQVINGLRNYLPNDSFLVFDTTDLLKSTSVAINMLIVFFNVVSVIAVILCFFLLWLSFDANVRENSWEFGVLRAIGLSYAQVIRVYVYEALSLILTASLLGSSIGMLVAITLQLQFNLFTEMPFQFTFPYTLFFSVFFLSIGVSVGGAYLPAKALSKKTIAESLKGSSID